MRKQLCILVLALAACSIAQGQNKELQVGERPPPLGWQKILRAPVGTQPAWQGLSGKVVVLEFWATWCAPCIRAIPHLNELAEAFKDKPVQFIAITDEEETIVSPFLTKKPIHAWIFLDTGKSMFKAYGVTGIPQTVVIDGAGNIAAVTSPTELNAQHITDVLAGKKLNLTAPARGSSFSFRPGEFPESANRDRDALFQVQIRPSEKLEGGWGGGGGKLTFIGSSVMTILSGSYGVMSTRIITNGELPDGRFDVVARTPSKPNAVGNLWLQEAVEATFGLSAKRETREMDALILTVANPKPEHLTPTGSTGGSSSHSGVGNIQTMNMPLSALAGSLEGLLKEPVLDETGLTNHFDCELQWTATDAEHSDAEAILKAVRDQLGLKLSAAKRPVEVLVVEKVNKENE